ncbi:hypothetical protein SBOR_0448 [Sclerotinia borealis F-4128]|uniref:Uncharacterized protein n=1 Tax=Sclerotinia borealis (strain F-4128) TaxID=1432307 RepID=W9CWY7_SCLBF|nr:hypothetical protein SBOR_0448 [Sclerotinia borealis F-4128]
MDLAQKESATVSVTAEKNDEAPIPAIMYGTLAVKGQSRIPYDFNYYGDFYILSSDQYRKTTDGLVLPPQDSDPFRFMDLPAEVRKLIFELIASTLLCFDSALKTYVNHVKIEKHIVDLFGKPRYGCQYEDWVEKYMDDHRATSGLPMQYSAEQQSKMLSEYDRYVMHIYEDHPDRNKYDMEIADHWLLPPNATRQELSCEFLEWFRKLLHVSAHFRLKLGSVIWARSCIHFCGDIDELVLGHFLKARPGISEGIKELVITVGDNDELSFLENVTDKSKEADTANFKALMKLVSQKLTLEYFTLRIGGTKGRLMALAAGEGPLEVLTSIRELQVTKNF